MTAHPQAGRMFRRRVRRFVVPRVPYLIFYRVDEAAKELAVLTIRHAARQEPN